MIRVTFNKPSVALWLENNGKLAKGLEVKLVKGGGISMRPSTHDKGKHIVALSYRERGGAEAEFTGNLVDEVAKALRNPYMNPFFTLKFVNGWIIAEPYKSPYTDGRKAEPPRVLPSLRVWSGEMHRSISPVMVGGEPVNRYSLLAVVEQAAKTVREHRESGHMGRPPIGVAAAKATMNELEIAARRHLPGYQMIETIYSKVGPSPLMHFESAPAVQAPVKASGRRKSSSPPDDLFNYAKEDEYQPPKKQARKAPVAKKRKSRSR